MLDRRDYRMSPLVPEGCSALARGNISRASPWPRLGLVQRRICLIRLGGVKKEPRAACALRFTRDLLFFALGYEPLTKELGD